MSPSFFGPLFDGYRYKSVNDHDATESIRPLNIISLRTDDTRACVYPKSKRRSNEIVPPDDSTRSPVIVPKIRYRTCLNKRFVFFRLKPCWYMPFGFKLYTTNICKNSKIRRYPPVYSKYWSVGVVATGGFVF